jgi:hypothetical protein
MPERPNANVNVFFVQSTGDLQRTIFLFTHLKVAFLIIYYGRHEAEYIFIIITLK